MLQYGWHCDNSKRLRKNTFQNWKIHVHSWGVLCTLFFSSLEDAPKPFFNSIFYVRVLPYTLKEWNLKFPKGSPHELPNFRQSLHWRMYDVPYSMYGFLQLIADGSPNKHQRKKKSKGRNRREYKRTPSLHQKGMRIRHRSWGVPFGELEKIIFKYNMKRNWSFRGTWFLVETF